MSGHSLLPPRHTYTSATVRCSCGWEVTFDPAPWHTDDRAVAAAVQAAFPSHLADIAAGVPVNQPELFQ